MPKRKLRCIGATLVDITIFHPAGRLVLLAAALLVCVGVILGILLVRSTYMQREHDQQPSPAAAEPLAAFPPAWATGTDYGDQLGHTIDRAGLHITRSYPMDPNGACSFSANNRVLFRVPDPATSAQVSAFFISGLGEGETVADVIEIWFATCAILASYIEPSHQAEFMGWLQEGFESFELTKVTGLRSQERWFGSRALRVEHRYSEFLGYTISVELNDRFPPLHDLNGGETAKSWADMRLGLTLEEVEAFAGPGRLQSSMGESRQYHFGEGYALGWVTFINGRAETWMAP